MSIRVPSQLKFALALTAILTTFPGPAGAQSANQIAQLTTNPSITGDAGNFGEPAISGDGNMIAVGASNLNATGVIYLYQKPSTDWTNAVQVATLVSPQGCFLGGNIVMNYDGSVIASRDGTGCTGGGASGFVVNVFERPAGGWQNNTLPSATLLRQNCPSATGGSMAMSPNGNTIVTTCGGHGHKRETSLLVFYKPVSGWSGTLAPTHVRSLGSSPNGPGPVAMSQKFIAADKAGNISVFARTPKGLGKQVATLTTSDGHALSGAMVMNDSKIFATGYDPTTFNGTVYVFETPSAGSPTTEIAQLSVSTPNSFFRLANSGRNLFLSPSFTNSVAWFIEPSSGWQTTSQPNLTITTSDPNAACYGVSVINGNIAIIADPCASFNDGNAFVFQLQP